MTPRRSAALAVLIAVLAAVTAIVALSAGGSSGKVNSLLKDPGATPKLAPAAGAPRAPELAGVGDFLNTSPVTMKQLRGRVVLVDFWTYTCINCRRTFPFLRKLSATYADNGLTVLGVHSPEFSFEKDPANVARAVRELGVTWPVAEDPQLKIWAAYGNQYWPADYLVDRAGRIRYVHVGEGGDGAIEQVVRTLLDTGGQAGVDRVGDVPNAELPPRQADDVTPESYFGAQRGANYLAGRAVVPTGQTLDRHDSDQVAGGQLPRDVIFLTGRFSGGDQSIVTAAPDARVQLHFRARDVYLTAAPDPGAAPVQVQVALDGKPVPAQLRGPSIRVTPQGDTVLKVAGDDLQHILTGPGVRDGVLTLTADRAGLRLFTFTFGV